MSLTVTTKENEALVNEIRSLVEISRQNSAKIWRDMAERLANGRRRYASINLYKIDKFAKDGDVIVVPGSVLGVGKITKKVTIGAVHFSRAATEKLVRSGCAFMSLSDVAKANPKGTNVKIMR
ncbi:50S ribosomal protein L18e [Thermoplasma volcanium]|uniref:Large ribosomal subunit protein eL18 n=1 Tax=Thermoplasma volcanium (strain ATCC 51530 / DSM 4299 / JCM 9571 / NBRC 15438 / GSS1) TaxID=273116 RepID=RL18E_THEVO|nr:50S ribosomal protein L18e [Thermoplasma volcanium]Q979K3.2 RecName: Full=Large ribosomal subunit protein eL18; AltName: Full=50S ribosomal protein L18e [Thermoplasma volcanium GSS1]